VTLFAVDRFALTANNVTYGVFGGAMKYWDFFPTDDPTYGRIPVWGFADVVESAHDDVRVGTRLYGYLPMGDELVIDAGRVDADGLTDIAEHRRPMAPAYSRYANCSADPGYRPDREAQQMVLSPLFFTSFMIDDLLGDNGYFGAASVVLSSASSKTSIGTAWLAKERPELRVVGLTSSTNRAFVAGLGCYDEVVEYPDVADLDAGASTVYVDVAGDPAVTAAVHGRFTDRLAHSMIVGASHWDRAGDLGGGELPGPTREMFFAPSQISKRSGEWGADGLREKVATSFHAYTEWTDGWLTMSTPTGLGEIERAFGELLEGRVPPSVGLACTVVESA